MNGKHWFSFCDQFMVLRPDVNPFYFLQNSSSWILLNLAAYYWRIKGNALEAVECLRQALYFSPRLGLYSGKYKFLIWILIISNNQSCHDFSSVSTCGS